MLKKKKGMERGRSMSDTLGGGALIGVLTLGGIYGYGQAIYLYKEAETLDQLSVLIAGSRSFDIPHHFGEKTLVDKDEYLPYIVPIREMVSKVDYRSEKTAVEAGLMDEEGEFEGVTIHDVREHEAFNTVLGTPVWVRAEDEQNWSVRITGLSYAVCEKLLQKHDLGFDYAYVALQNWHDKTPADPESGDFSKVGVADKYANPQKDIKGGFSNEAQIEKICSMVDASKGKDSLAQAYLQNINDAEITGVTNNTAGTICKDKKSLACMAYGARLYNPETKKKDIPLQTLVLHFGSGDVKSAEVVLPPPEWER